MGDKIFCGKGKEIDGKYGVYYAINLCLSNIPQEYVTTFKNQQYVKLDLSMMRARDEKGNTHTLTVNTWKPDNSNQPTSQRPPQRQNDFPGPEDFQEDIPF